MRPGLHYHLEWTAFAALLFFHTLVVWPFLNLTVLPLLDWLGVETKSTDQDIAVGMIVYWLVHLIIFIFELFLIYRLHRWKKRKGATCPKCRAQLKIIEKTFSPITVYLCEGCNYRRSFDIPGRQGGG